MFNYQIYRIMKSAITKTIGVIENAAVKYNEFADENEAYIGAGIVLFTILFFTLIIL